MTAVVGGVTWSARFPRRRLLPTSSRAWDPSPEAIRTLAVLQSACSPTVWEFAFGGVDYKYNVTKIRVDGSMVGSVWAWREPFGWSKMRDSWAIERAGRLVLGTSWMRKVVRRSLGDLMASAGILGVDVFEDKRKRKRRKA